MDHDTIGDGSMDHSAPGLRHLGSGENSFRKSGETPSGARANEDLSGNTLGDYKLTRKIAQGGMGTVYEAMQIKLDRKVAIKVLDPELAADPVFLQRFEREAKSAAALNHPNITQVFDFGHAGERHYLVMEFVDGEDLSARISRVGKLPIPEALELIHQVAVALKAACDKSIIHRDIKPANLMVTASGNVKVSDLGLAKKLAEVSDITMTGIGIGSPHYLAPEQADDASKVDHRADIYSLGITLLQLVTGKRPYDGFSPFSIVFAHAKKPLPSGRDLGTELPPDLEAVIAKMTAKEPSDRYPSYDALLVDIAKLRAGNPVSKPRVARGAKSSGDIGWIRSPAIAVGVVILVVVLGVIGWKVRANRNASARIAAVGRIAGFDGYDPAWEALPQLHFGSGLPIDATWMPIPVLTNEIAHASAEKMLAEADAYAKEHPSNYRGILGRYYQLRAFEDLGALGERVDASLKEWFNKRQAVVDAAIANLDGDLHAYVTTRRGMEANRVVEAFPEQLRSRRVEQRIRQFTDHIPPPPGEEGQGFDGPPPDGPGGRGGRGGFDPGPGGRGGRGGPRDGRRGDPGQPPPE